MAVLVSVAGNWNEEMENIPLGSLTDTAAAVGWVDRGIAIDALEPRGSATSRSPRGKV